MSIWLNFLKYLQPVFIPPTRYKLNKSLLNSEYEKAKVDTANKIQEASVLAIMTDEWTNINGAGILNILLSTPTVAFWKSFDREFNRETGEYVAKQLDSVILEVGSEKVRILITDSARNMQAA